MSKCLRFTHKHRKHACHEDYGCAREAYGPARPNILRCARGRVGVARGRVGAARGRGRAAERARLKHLAATVATSGGRTRLGDRQETSGRTVKGKMCGVTIRGFSSLTVISHIFCVRCTKIEEQ
jgi:hypothetical protein